ncbi:MAG: GWxTD domain-containing protein, partial [Acidobacteriota bacterium]
MNASRRVVGLTLVALLAAPPAQGTPNYKKWLNQEVVWIISKAERKEFKSLKEDSERDAFIGKFWLRRDPTPATERNEYKEEHYRRHIFATHKFQEGIPGWKSDRGRVYIIHGPPAAEYSFEPRHRISPTRQIAHTERSPRTIVWVYHQNPLAEYYKGEIRLVFQPKGGMIRQDFVLSESKTAQDKADQMARKFFPASDANWMEADVRYRLTMAGPPAVINATGADLPNSGVGEFARYVHDVFRSPGEVLEARQRKLRRLTESRQELKRSVQAGVSFDQLDFEVDTMTFHRPQADWLLPVQLRIASQALSEQKVEIYAALIDSQ